MLKPSRPKPTLSQVQAELLRLSQRRFRALAFPYEMERTFDAAHTGVRARVLWHSPLLLLATLLFTLAIDFVCLRPHVVRALLVRVFAALLAAGFGWLLFRFPRRPALREGTIVLGAGLICAGSFVLYRNVPAPLAAITQISLLLTLFFTNVLMRVRLPFAAASTAFCIGSNLLYLHFEPALDDQSRIAYGLLVSSAAVFILFAAYVLETEERHAWLLHLRDNAHRDDLRRLNSHLQHLSNVDGLTGIPNRASFDRQVEALWTAAEQTRTPLSVVLFDVDHFKIVNDTFGHLYGDEVLKRIAALLQQSLRGKNDFVARYGGEEFVLLLPETPQEVAVMIADRVRALVQLAGSPAVPENVPVTGVWSTISAGVATAIPSPGMTPRQLLHAADTALYAAKAAGRNCVQSANPTFA